MYDHRITSKHGAIETALVKMRDDEGIPNFTSCDVAGRLRNHNHGQVASILKFTKGIRVKERRYANTALIYEFVPGETIKAEDSNVAKR